MKNVKKMNLMLMKAYAILLLAGCTADDLMERPGEMPVSLKTRVLLTGGELTRAGITVQGTQFDAGETFYAYFPSGVRVGNATSSSSTTFTTSDSDGATTPATQPYFNVGTTTASVHAYYPYVSGKQVTNTTTSFTVEQDQSTDANYKKSDLMYATIGSLSKSGSTVTGTLTFTHKMSKIMVTAVKGEGITNIQSVRIVGGSRTINISTPQSCTLGSTLSNANTTSSYVTMWSGTSTSTVDCAALIPPQTITGNFLQIVTDKGTVTYSLDAKVFASGKSYQAILTVTDALVGTTIDLSEWTGTGDVVLTPGGGDQGDFTIAPISSVTYDGSAHTPALVVKRNGITLTKDAANGYTCQWVNNTNAGIAAVVVLGQGIYEGLISTATFTILKTSGSISYSVSSMTVDDGDEEFTNPLTHTGDGIVTYASSDNDVAGVNAATGEVSVYDFGTTTITATVADGTNYTYAAPTTVSYTLTVSDIRPGSNQKKKNPLYYMAEKNCGEGMTFVEDDADSWLYTWSTAMSNYAAQTTVYEGWQAANKTIEGASGTWHLPTYQEWSSIIPCGSSRIFGSSGLTGYRSMSRVCFGYNDDTKAGIEDHSYWMRQNYKLQYAIRFIGTDYCSVWKYEILDDNHYVRISATMIGNVITDNNADAATWWNEHQSEVTFGNSGRMQQRLIPYVGYSSGSDCKSNGLGTGAYYWSTTNAGGNNRYAYDSGISGSNSWVFFNSQATSYAFAVRLFRDK